MKPEFVIVHHSATRDSGTVSWGAIRRYHTDTLGWSAIGYHAGVEMTTDPGAGLTAETFMGRPWHVNGAHCRHAGMNRKGLGVCLVGNFDEVAPPPAQLERAAELVDMWCRLFSIPLDNIKGHRDYHPSKTCPGNLFDLDAFRDQVAALLD